MGVSLRVQFHVNNNIIMATSEDVVNVSITSLMILIIIILISYL